MPTPDASEWTVQSIDNNNLALILTQQVEAGMTITITLVQFGQTQDL